MAKRGGQTPGSGRAIKSVAWESAAGHVARWGYLVIESIESIEELEEALDNLVQSAKVGRIDPRD